MNLLCIGLNHQTAPVHIREKVAVSKEEMPTVLGSLCNLNCISEAVILSTCNRTEIYCHVANNHKIDIAIEHIKTWFSEVHNLTESNLSNCMYQHQNEEAINHIYRVVCGLDSLVLGEPQILGQVKSSFSHAHKLGHTSKLLNRLFQTAFSVAKNVRSSTLIGANAVSVAAASVALAKQIFTDINKQCVLLIGAGETIELVCKHLISQGVTNIIIANRTLSNAEQLAAQFNAQAISLDELQTRLPDADMVFSSTGSTLPILGKGTFENALKKRKNAAMLVIDLAVPRDVEKQVNELERVYLYTVDDLNSVVDQNKQSRKQAALDAQQIIDKETQKFVAWLTNLDAIPTIKNLRLKTSNMVNQELEIAKKKLHQGESPEKTLELFAHALTQKFLHNPTEHIHQTSDKLTISAVQDLFDLDSDIKN